MASYLSIDAFKLLSVMPSADIDAREAAQAGYVTAQLESASGVIDAQLAKRYAVPLATAPDIVKRWVTDLATYKIWQRRGWDATDEQAAQIKADADKAEEQIQKAANAVDGLYDLPLASGQSGISKGGPLGYSEASPYVWTDRQVETGRAEDSNRGGSYRG